MFSTFLRQFRIAIIVCIGIAVALAIGAGVFLSLAVNPESLSLAERTDPSQVMVFIATPDRERFFETIQRFAALMNNRMPAEQDVAPADMYEVALLDSGSGSTEWIIYGRNLAEETHVMLTSGDSATLLLPIAKRRQSLATQPLFAAARTQAPSLLWLKTAVLPLPQSDAADIARAILSPYTEAVVLFDAKGKGKIMLSSTVIDLRGNVLETEMGNAPSPLLGISLSEPVKILQSVTEALTAKHPALAEGLAGILKAQSQIFMGTSDVSQITKDLLSNPTSLMIEPREDGRMRFVIAGTAASSIIRDSWLTTMATAMKEGNVRHMEFFQKEYTRTDVTAADAQGWQEAGTYNNWSLRHLGGTGSDLMLVVATSGRRYIAGNDEYGVKTMIDNAGTKTSLGSGTADIGWLVTEIETRLPFLKPSSSVSEALLSTASGRLTWRITTVGGHLMIEWSLVNS